MKTHLVSGLALFLILAGEMQSAGQVASVATRDVSSNSAISFEVTVLGLPRAALSALGIVIPEPGRGAPGFAVPLPDGQEKLLINDPQTIAVHNLTLQAPPGIPTRVRVDTRVPAPNISAESYFEVSLGLEVTPRVVLGRNIAMTAGSVVQIRRGSPGSLPSVLFETDQIRHEVQVPDGKVILLGGFITAADSPRLPNVPMNSGNPILRYVYSKVPGKGDESEVVVLLTPRLTGAVNDVAPSAPPVVQTAPTNSTLNPATFPPAPALAPVPAPKAEPLPVATAPATASRPPVVTAPVSPPAELTSKTEIAAPVPSASVTRPPVVEAPVTSAAVLVPRTEPPVTGTPPAGVTRRLILPAPVSPAGTPTSSRPFYSVQVGAFDSVVNAEALIGELKKKFEGAYVDKAATGRTPYRVRVGRLSDMAAARQLQRKLEDQGFDSFVVFTNSP